MRFAAILALACGGLLAQSAPVAPAFDVASFRRHPVGAPHGGARREVTSTRLTLHNATLGVCLLWAYGYQHFQVIGPNWRDFPTDVVYEIDARTGSPVSGQAMMRMLQTLLRERLKLEFHRETRDLPVYALVVAKGGPKFQKSATAGDPSMKPVRAYVEKYERFSMAQLAKSMDPPFTSRHTIDETGLAGVYDFTIDMRPYVTDAFGKPILDGLGAIDEESGYVQALPAQLGLRLKRKTAPLEVMVIDHVERDPTAN
jgi:uncharacterized protein (TIGR03435 family)